MKSYKLMTIGGDRGVHEKQTFSKLREIGLMPTWHYENSSDVKVPQTAGAVIIFSDLTHSDRKQVKKDCEKRGIPFAVITKQFGMWKDLLMKKFPIDKTDSPDPLPIIPNSVREVTPSVLPKHLVLVQPVVKLKPIVAETPPAPAMDQLDRVVTARNELLKARQRVGAANDSMVAAADLLRQAEKMMADARQEYDQAIKDSTAINLEFDAAVESWKATDFAVGLSKGD